MISQTLIYDINQSNKYSYCFFEDNETDNIQDIFYNIEKVVIKAFDVSKDEFSSPTRSSAEAAFARQVAMYLAHICFGFNFCIIGKFFKRDRTTAAYACKVIEDKRDKRSLDMTLDVLELTIKTNVGQIKYQNFITIERGELVHLNAKNLARNKINY